MNDYDYIIVGAGSAGCVLANRLSADANIKILLLEAGPRDKSMWLHIPAGLSRVFFHKTLNWGYFTEPEPHLKHRRIYWPRGKTLGGSSAINGLAYVRGQPLDYDDWRQSGNAGWGWDDVLPYFLKSERQQRGASELHNANGPLSVDDPVVRHSTAKAFIEAARNAGVPENEDFNGRQQEGVGFLQFTVRNGARHSTATAFLRPVTSRKNLTVETEALTRRILFEGRRAIGVEYEQHGEIKQAKAGREVILSAGAINSPHILLLSGVGPERQLREKGIDVAHDLPGVGENLHDHMYVHYTCETRPGHSINGEVAGMRLLPHVLDYYLRGRGYLTMGASQVCAFVRGLPGSERPDLQINFRPMSSEFTPEGKLVPHSYPGMTASCCFLRPQSRGRVFLKSSDPKAAPAMVANYLSDPTDVSAMLSGVGWMRKIFASAPLKSLVVAEKAPGARRRTDAEILEYIEDFAQSMYHPVGTCKMGQDTMAVVDEKLRVRGIEGLRVVDASIMPTISSGNTNAPSIMIAEKGADMINQARKDI